MLSIKQLREAAGGLDNLSDEDIVDGMHETYKAYYPDRDKFAKKIGYEGAGRGKNASRMSAAVDMSQASLQGLVEDVATKSGLPGVGAWARKQREANEASAGYAQRRAADLGAIDRWTDDPETGTGGVHGLRDAGDYFAGKLIQSGPQLGSTALATIAGTMAGGPGVGMAAGLAVGVPQYQGSNLQAQREQGTGETDLLAATATAIPQAAIDAFTGGTGRVVNAITGTGVRWAGNAAKRAGKEALRTGAEEAAGEVAQNELEQFNRMAVDPNETYINPKANDRRVESAIGGLVVGGAIGGVAGGLRGAKRPPNTNTTTVSDIPGESTDVLQGNPPAMPTPAPVGEPQAAQPLAGEPQTSTEPYAAAGAVDPPQEAAPPAPPADTNAIARKAAIDQAAREFAGRKAKAYEDLVEPDEAGKPQIQLKPQDVVLHHDISALEDAGTLTPAQAATYIGAMKEALQTEDKKGLNHIRKEVEEIKNPKPVAAPAVAQTAAPVTAPATPAVSTAAETAAQSEAAPVTAPVTAPAPAPAKVKKAPASAKSVGFKEAFGSLVGGGVSEDLYNGLFKALQEGKTTHAGVKDPILVQAKPKFDAGEIKSAADLRAWVQAGSPPLVAPAPKPAPETPVKAAEPKVTDYTPYAGRSVSIEVARGPGVKPLRRSVKDAKVALEEADSHISKFEQLARCING